MALYGLIGGLNGAACMSVLRLAARRIGLIDRMAPQAVVEWSRARTRSRRPVARISHHLADQIVHLGVGSLGGAVYGAVTARRPRSTAAAGAAFGAAVWAVAFVALAPVLGIARPPWRARRTENAVNVAAHLVYGVVTALMMNDLARQRRWASSDVQRRVMRVG